MNITEIEAAVGKTLQAHQRAALDDAYEQVQSGKRLRLCLYHRTGAGKTITALAAMARAGSERVTVLAPPITHDEWRKLGSQLGIKVHPFSHAKFRQTGFKVSRETSLIVDEFHLLGSHSGKGWKKLDRITKGLKAPLVIASATPNYNDAERVYCIQHVLDPLSVRGGYLQFLYDHCVTRVNPFGAVPLVDGFKGGLSAEEYLRDLPQVHYVEDEAIKQVNIIDVSIGVPIPDEFDDYGVNRRTERVVASMMEAKHARNKLVHITDDGETRSLVYEVLLEEIRRAAAPVLVFSASATIATVLHQTLEARGDLKSLLVTGRDSNAAKISKVDLFKTGKVDVLIGTATLATGTDGIDKMCDHLLILDDTDDDSLRRQLIGRILPRGLDDDVSRKTVVRLNVA